MRVIRVAEVEIEPIATATPIPGWIGGDVKRTRQPLLPAGASNSGVMIFPKSDPNIDAGDYNQ